MGASVSKDLHREAHSAIKRVIDEVHTTMEDEVNSTTTTIATVYFEVAEDGELICDGNLNATSDANSTNTFRMVQASDLIIRSKDTFIQDLKQKKTYESQQKNSGFNFLQLNVALTETDIITKVSDINESIVDTKVRSELNIGALTNANVTMKIRGKIRSKECNFAAAARLDVYVDKITDVVMDQLKITTTESTVSTDNATKVTQENEGFSFNIGVIVLIVILGIVFVGGIIYFVLKWRPWPLSLKPNVEKPEQHWLPLGPSGNNPTPTPNPGPH